MKFVVSSSILLKNLKLANGAVSSNAVVPILENFLFSLDHKKLSVLATDLETVVRIKIEVESNDKCQICVPAKILLEILSNLPTQPLTFNIDLEKLNIEILTNNGKYKIRGEDAVHYPTEPKEKATNSINMTRVQLADAIHNTLFAISTDELRVDLSGLLFEIENNKINFVSTDGHRLVRHVDSDIVSNKEVKLVVPKKPLSTLKNLLTDTSASDDITINYSNEHIFVHNGDKTLIAKLVESNFPNYRDVLPDGNPFILKIDTQTLQNALKRVSVLSNRTTNLVRFAIKGSVLKLTAEDTTFDFKGNEVLSCNYIGEDIVLAFNAKFLIEMLSVINAETVQLELVSASKPALLRPATDENNQQSLLMLIVPLIYNGTEDDEAN